MFIMLGNFKLLVPAGENNIMAVCLFYIFIFRMKSRLLHVNKYRITVFKPPTVCLHGNNFIKIFD
jgi:hypothetical protein